MSCLLKMRAVREELSVNEKKIADFISAKMIQITRQARKAGVSIISLTNYSANPIRSLADVQLFSVNQEVRFEVAQIISNASQQHVVDILFSLMLKRDARAKELLALSRKAVEEI